jgi:hypothetical protein
MTAPAPGKPDSADPPERSRSVLWRRPGFLVLMILSLAAVAFSLYKFRR